MIIRCNVCQADPAARWKQPAMSIYVDPYKPDGGIRNRAVFSCRDHLSVRREEEIQQRERAFGFPVR